MKIYDEITNEELTSPDLAAGCLYTARRGMCLIPRKSWKRPSPRITPQA